MEKNAAECCGTLTAFLDVLISGFLPLDLGLGPPLGHKIQEIRFDTSEGEFHQAVFEPVVGDDIAGLYLPGLLH